MLRVQRASPGMIRLVAESSLGGDGERWVNAIEMPLCRAVIARDDITTMAHKATSIAGDDVAFRIPSRFVVWLVEKASPVHFGWIVILRSRQANLFIFPLFSGLDSFKVVSYVVR
jgi:hypothetical protein